MSPLAGLEQKSAGSSEGVSVRRVRAGPRISHGRERGGGVFISFAKLIRSAPPDEAVRLTSILGTILRIDEEHEAALETFREAILLEPSDPLQLVCRAQQRGVLPRHARTVIEEAEALLREAVRIDPRRPTAHKNLGMAAESLGRPADAVLHYVHATRLCPSDPRAYNLLRDLAANEPLLRALVPGLETMLEACRDLVEQYSQGSVDYCLVRRGCRRRTARFRTAEDQEEEE